MSLRHAILGLLAEHPASGYDLMKTLTQSLANVWPATQSQVYSELTRLANEGLLTAAAEGPRRRKEYAITPSGRHELHHWLTELEPERTRRSDMLLRVFFLGTLTTQEARDFLLREASAADDSRRALDHLMRSTAWKDGENLSLYGRLALEYGLRLAAMKNQWAAWAADQLNTHPLNESQHTSTPNSQRNHTEEQ
jgi:DNA-binding PadR family transcriptional regulator